MPRLKDRKPDLKVFQIPGIPAPEDMKQTFLLLINRLNNRVQELEKKLLEIKKHLDEIEGKNS